MRKLLLCAASCIAGILIATGVFTHDWQAGSAQIFGVLLFVGVWRYIWKLGA
jgi:hypothetical protein